MTARRDEDAVANVSRPLCENASSLFSRSPSPFFFCCCCPPWSSPPRVGMGAGRDGVTAKRPNANPPHPRTRTKNAGEATSPPPPPLTQARGFLWLSARRADYAPWGPILFFFFKCVSCSAYRRCALKLHALTRVGSIWGSTGIERVPGLPNTTLPDKFADATSQSYIARERRRLALGFSLGIGVLGRSTTLKWPALLRTLLERPHTRCC